MEPPTGVQLDCLHPRKEAGSTAGHARFTHKGPPWSCPRGWKEKQKERRKEEGKDRKKRRKKGEEEEKERETRNSGMQEKQGRRFFCRRTKDAPSQLVRRSFAVTVRCFRPCPWGGSYDPPVGVESEQPTWERESLSRKQPCCKPLCPWPGRIGGVPRFGSE